MNIKVNFVLIIVALMLIISCSQQESGRTYISENNNQYGVLLDSTFYFMCGYDSVFYYDLHHNATLNIRNRVVNTYNITYTGSACFNEGYGIDCPLIFAASENSGGLPLVISWNDEELDFGGYRFQSLKGDSAKIVFDKWTNLMLSNRDAAIQSMLKN